MQFVLIFEQPLHVSALQTPDLLNVKFTEVKEVQSILFSGKVMPEGDNSKTASLTTQMPESTAAEALSASSEGTTGFLKAMFYAGLGL